MATKILQQRWPWLLAGLVALCVFLFSLFVRVGDPRPLGGVAEIESLAQRDDVNVIFILIDTLRAHRLGSYGYERDTSPSIDYLAAQGIRFDKHLAQSSWTKCSMASLWTGLNPDRTGIMRFNDAAPKEAVMPAEIFREAGYRTGGIFRNGWVAANFGFDQGFEVYERPIPDKPSATVRRENPHIKLLGTDDAVMDSAIEFLRVHGGERFFLYLHLMDVHQYLYDANTALFGNTYSDVYDNSLRHEDAVLAELLAYLTENGYLDDTLLVIASDHGEAFAERGYDGHAKHIYRESTEVPFVISLPFRVAGGIVVPTRSRNVDVWPTVLDLLGLSPLPDTDGESLVPEILASARGETLPADDRVATAYLDKSWGSPREDPQHLIAVAQGDFRFVRSMPKEAGEPVDELFDASRDPLERQNVIAEQPEVAALLRERAKRFLEPKESPWGVETPRVHIDEMKIHQLRALGYAIGK
jgi:arylsulfatase A-like enzyme